MQLTPQQWVDNFRSIGRRLLNSVPKIAGTPDASVKLRRGAGGDQTFFIDELAEKIVIEALEDISRQGIDFTLISEECGIKRFGTESNTTILLDPLDGSNNAKRGVPYFATSIAVLDGNMLDDIIAGYVLDLPNGREYWAIKGEGAWCNNEKIICQNQNNDELGMVAFEASVPSKDIARMLTLLTSSRKVRCMGAVALDLALMAAGAVDVLAIATPSRSFDYAAGMLILKEAGGIITDLTGGELKGISAGIERTVPLLAASNKILHQKAVELLNNYHPQT